jgi:hypothetical protein
MVISDLTYQESAADTNDVEGGTDWTATLTAFNQVMSMLQTGATSGPNGSSAYANIGRLNTNTFGLGALVLGANNPNLSVLNL